MQEYAMTNAELKKIQVEITAFQRYPRLNLNPSASTPTRTPS